MKRFIILIALYFLNGLFLIGQEGLDFEIKTFNQATVSEKAQLIHRNYINIIRYEQDSILYFIDYLRIAGFEQNNDAAIAICNMIMGYYLNERALYKQGEEKLLRAKLYFEKVGNDTLLAETYNLLGNNSYYIGRATSAEKYYLESYQTALRTGLEKYQVLPKPNLARLYIEQGKQDLALNLINEYLDFHLSNNHYQNIASAYGQRGELYLSLENYEMAKNDFEKSMDYGLKAGTPKIVANGYTNLAINEFYTENYNKAKEYFMLALKYRMDLEDKYYIAESYFNLANLFDAQDLLDSAIFYYNKCLALNKESNNFKGQIEVLEILDDIYNEKNMPSKRIVLLSEIVTAQKELAKQEHLAEIKALSQSFEQTITDNQQLSDKRESSLFEQIKNFQNIFRKGILLSAIGGSIILFFILYSKDRQEKRKHSEKEKST